MLLSQNNFLHNTLLYSYTLMHVYLYNYTDTDDTDTCVYCVQCDLLHKCIIDVFIYMYMSVCTCVCVWVCWCAFVCVCVWCFGMLWTCKAPFPQSIAGLLDSVWPRLLLVAICYTMKRRKSEHGERRSVSLV